MHVRAIALALPAVLGIACTHTRSERSAQTTTQASTTQTGQPSQNEHGQPGPEAPGQIASNPNPATSGPGSSAQGTTGSQASSDATGSASPGDVTRDPIMESGDPAKAHADDQVVSGTIARVSRRMIVIDSETGDQKTLFLAPETTIEVGGQDAHRSDLQQGQDVRASFSEVDGRPIAVKVRAGQNAAGSSDAGSTSRSSTGGQDSGSWSTPGQGTGTVTPPPDDPSSSGNPDTSPEAPNGGGSTGPR